MLRVSARVAVMMMVMRMTQAALLTIVMSAGDDWDGGVDSGDADTDDDDGDDAGGDDHAVEDDSIDVHIGVDHDDDEGDGFVHDFEYDDDAAAYIHC